MSLRSVVPALMCGNLWAVPHGQQRQVILKFALITEETVPSNTPPQQF